MTEVSFSTGSFRLAQADTPAPDAATTHPVEETHAGTAAEGGAHKGEFPPFAPQYFLAQIIWLAIAFGALYYILSRYALPRIGGILAERQGRLDADFGEAQRLRGESDVAMRAYEEALTSARSSAQRIAGETRDAVAREADARRKTLEGDLAGKLAEAEAQIAATKHSALGNVRSIASEAAGEIVARLTGIVPSQGELEQAVDAALGKAAA